MATRTAVHPGMFCWLIAASLLSSKPVIAESVDSASGNAPSLQSLDLSSTERNRNAELPAGGSVSIQVGQDTRVVTTADLLTSAELVAVQQVMNGNVQTLQLSGAGNAVGGSFHLTESSLHNLVVPSNVTLLRDFGTAGTLSLAGALNNSGNFFAFSSSQLTNTANIAASQIFNQQGAILSSALPPSLAGLQGVSNLNLSLSAAQSIFNAGTISSAGSLTLTAGDTIINAGGGATSAALTIMQAVGNVNLQAAHIVNAGTVASTMANINIAGPALSNLLVNNIGGRFEASSGAFNVRDVLFSSKFDVSVIGGDILSQTVNLFSGAGTIDVNVGNLPGLVNLSASQAHIQADTANLQFGTVTLNGDPTFISTGNLVLPAATSGQPFIAVAGGNITVLPGFVLDTSSATADGGRIFLVAGANATSAAGSVTITGRSGMGGDIDLTGITAINSSSSAATGSGGEISMLAFSSSPGSSQGGHVLVPNAVTITTGTAGAIGAGKLLVAAEGSATQVAPNSISIGAYDGVSSTVGSGGVELLTISPDVSADNPLVINEATGVITAGTAGSGPMRSGAVISGDLMAPGAIVRILGGGGIATGTVSAETLHLSSGSGNIGTSLVPILTDAVTLSANTQGEVFLRDSAAVVNLAQSSGTNFSLQAPSGRIDIKGDLTATVQLSLSAMSGINAVETVGATILVGASPTGIAVSPLANQVFVANTASDTVSVIDIATNTVVNVIAVGAGPRGVAVSPDGSLVYVANSASDSVSVISTASGTVIKTIQVSGTPTGVTFNSAGNMAFVSSTASNTVTFIDTAQGEVVGSPVNVQSGPEAIAFNRSNSLLYVANRTANSISVVDPSTRIVTNFPLAFSPVGFGPCPCGTKIFVSDGVSTVHAFSTEVNSVVVSIPLPVGSQPSGIGINPTGSLAYVANAGNGTVSTITTLTNTISSTTLVGGAPSAFGAFASFVDNKAVAYVANSATNSVSLIRNATLSAPSYSLSSDTGQINVTTVSGAVQATNNNGSVVITSANSIVSNGGTGTAYQLATPLSIEVLAPITAQVMDLHAINGVFTNRSTITATGALFFVASSNIVNYGTMQTVNAAASGVVGLQAPSGMLNISLGPVGLLRASAPGNTGTIALNPAGGSVLNVNGAAGSEISADVIGLEGNRERYTVDINSYQISGEINIRRSPTRTVITNSIGDLSIGTAILNQATGAGSSLYVSSAGNLSVKSLSANFTGVNSNNTYLYLVAQGNIAFTEGVSLLGPATGNGGTLNVLAPFGSVSLANSATSAFNASGGSGGTLLMSAQSYQIDAVNPGGSSLEAVGTVGRGGYVQATSLGMQPLVIGASGGPNFILGSITANGVSGGSIRANAVGLNVAVGGLLSANGTGGAGGSIGLSGSAVPFAVVNNGTLTATNGADNSGAAGLTSAPFSSVSVSGMGTIHGGSFVSFGNLDPVTLFPVAGVVLPPGNSFQFGGVTVQQGAPVGNLIAVGLVEPVKTVSARESLSSASPAAMAVNVVPLPQLPANGLIETDKVRIAFATPGQSSVESVPEGGALLQMTVISSANSTSNAIDVSTGRVLVTAAQDLSVHTPFASVFLKQGDVVLINVQEDAIAVYDLHDKSGIKVRADRNFFNLAPGGAFYLSRGKATALSRINAEGFPLRDINQSSVDNDSFSVITAEFSFPSAMAKIGFLRSARNNGTVDDRRTLQNVYKAAAALSILKRNQAPFRGP